MRHFLESGKRICILKRPTSRIDRIRDIADRISFYEIPTGSMVPLLIEAQAHTVIHCATDYGRRDVPVTEIIEANLLLPLRLLEASSSTALRTFVNTDTLLDKRINHYSLSKRHFREWLENFSTPPVRCNIALEHFFGPGDDRTKFVTKTITELLDNQELIDLTPGEQRRDFIFISDVVEAFKCIIDFADHAQEGYYSYEVGGGQTTEIREFVSLVKKLVGNKLTKLNFGALPYRNNEIMESRVDLSALRDLGWWPKVSLVEGLRQTIEGERNL